MSHLATLRYLFGSAVILFRSSRKVYVEKDQPNEQFSMEQRLKDLLSNLGRRTLRGVKACPKCGTYNGTRGFSCKNKSCDVVFKAADDRKKKTTEACRISTDNQNAHVIIPSHFKGIFSDDPWLST